MNYDDKIEDGIYDFYREADENTIKDLLKENISDLPEYEKKKRKFMFLAKAAANKKHDEYLLSLVKKFQDAIMLNVEKPVAMLKQLIAQKDSLAFYRNLDQLSKEDIIEIIKDKNLVELLEQLENYEKH